MRKESSSALNIIRGIALKFVGLSADSYTLRHSFEVASLAKFIADEMHLNSREKNVVVLCGLVHDLALKDSLKSKRFKWRNFIEVAALVHDVGKLPLLDLFKKTGLFTKEEWELVKQHPLLSAEAIKSLGNDYATAVAEAVKHHHERWDGKGYPYGKKAEEIPLAARIIAVADAFHAMTSERNYRQEKIGKKSLTEEEALAELEAGKEKQFDPRVVNAFVKAFRAGKRPSRKKSKFVSLLEQELLKLLKKVQSEK